MSRRGHGGVEAVLVATLVVAAAVLPGRWALASREGAFAAGLCSDLVVLMVPLGVVVAAWLWKPGRWRLVTGLLALGLWGTMITLTESTLSRGVFPSWVDAAVMARSPAMMEGSLDMFLLPRNLVPTLAVLPVVGLVWWRRPPRIEDRRRAGVAAAATWLVLASLLMLGAGEQRSPLSLIAPPHWAEAWTCATGPCEPSAALAAASEKGGGEHLLGWPPARGEGHPFRRDWPATEARGSSLPVVEAADAFGAALFAGDDEPTEIWQIALEGFRGDDLHAIHPAAPRDLAPFLNGLYDDAATVKGRRVWTAGLRTPHGVSALTCGLGTLPFGLALPRDLDAAALRCLPELLGEAGYDLGYVYGGAPAFDRLGRFFEARGMKPRLTAAELERAPRTAWGATDRHVFDAASRHEVGGWSYHFVLSLSHHHPYGRIPDLPAEVDARAAAVRRHAEEADAVDRRRLTAVAYTDDALRRLFARLAQRRALVIVTADHPIPEPALWRPRLPEHAEQARIPFVVWTSPALAAQVRDPRALAAATDAMNEQLARGPLSQNDVPTLLLAMLAQSAPLRALPPRARWHSMGGQATSPHFRAPVDGGRVMGINAATTFYVVDDRGEPRGTPEPARLVVTLDAARQVTPSLLPAAAALRRLMPVAP